MVFKELNGVFEIKHNKAFTDILPKVCNLKAIAQPQVKESSKRPCKIGLIRDCEKRMSENIAITHLAECEADASYVRKRKMTSFTTVSSEPCAPYSIYRYKWVDIEITKYMVVK